MTCADCENNIMHRHDTKGDEMSTEATELELFWLNDYETYKNCYLPVARNMARHWQAENFSRTLAIVSMKHGSDAASINYHRQHADPSTKWYELFTVADRQQVAESLVDGLIAEFANGYADPEDWR